MIKVSVPQAKTPWAFYCACFIASCVSLKLSLDLMVPSLPSRYYFDLCTWCLHYGGLLGIVPSTITSTPHSTNSTNSNLAKTLSHSTSSTLRIPISSTATWHDVIQTRCNRNCGAWQPASCLILIFVQFASHCFFFSDINCAWHETKESWMQWGRKITWAGIEVKRSAHTLLHSSTV